jgi:hypothetical protein
MSEFTSLLCDCCHYEIGIGWVGKECNKTVVICSECSHDFYIYPAPGEELYNSNQPYQILIRSKKWEEVISKKGRVKKQVLRDTWINSGIRIPIHEAAVLVGESLQIRYEFVFDQVHCLNCNAQGSLVEYKKYYQTCPNCKIGQMR